MAYRVQRSEDTDRDLQAIYRFLVESFVSFGEARADAHEQAPRRLEQIERAMEGLGAAPHQGTLRPEVAAGLRSVTKDRAVFYFDVDDEARLISVVAIFFGGQDHLRLMLKRLSGE